MAGEVRTPQGEAEPSRDRHVHHRQTDRDARPAFENVVQETVARIVVVLVVAVEEQIMEQNVSRDPDDLRVIRMLRQKRARSIGDRIETRQPRRGFQRRVFLAR